MEKSWIFDYDTEPKYMQLNDEEKRKTYKVLLIIPIICAIVLSVILLGEIFPTSSLPSVTKARYLIQSNAIAKSLLNNNASSITNHMIAFYDNKTIQYKMNGGLNIIQAKTNEQVNNISKLSEPCSVIMARALYQENNTGAASWLSVGFISTDQGDVATIYITFKSLDDYTIRIEPTTPEQGDLTDEEYEQIVEEYKQTDIYQTILSASKYLDWFSNILSGQDENLILIRKILNSDKKTKDSVNTYWGEKFCSGYEDPYYRDKLTEATLKLSNNYKIDDITITHSEFNTNFNTIVSKLYISIVDENNNNGHISATCFYTPLGYKIVPKSVKFTYDAEFRHKEADAFVESLNNSFR